MHYFFLYLEHCAFFNQNYNLLYYLRISSNIYYIYPRKSLYTRFLFILEIRPRPNLIFLKNELLFLQPLFKKHYTPQTLDSSHEFFAQVNSFTNHITYFFIHLSCRLQICYPHFCSCMDPEIQANTCRPFCQIWEIFMPVCHRPSKVHTATEFLCRFLESI